MYSVIPACPEPGMFLRKAKEVNTLGSWRSHMLNGVEDLNGAMVAG